MAISKWVQEVALNVSPNVIIVTTYEQEMEMVVLKIKYQDKGSSQKINSIWKLTVKRKIL